MKLSLVVPCLNEEENVQKFYNTVKDTFNGLIKNYEIVFVNDGSTDKTGENLEKIFNEDSSRVQVLTFSRNFGKEAAIYAGLSNAKGDLVCIIDADLQQHPSVVVEIRKIVRKTRLCQGLSLLFIKSSIKLQKLIL